MLRGVCLQETCSEIHATLHMVETVGVRPLLLLWYAGPAGFMVSMQDGYLAASRKEPVHMSVASQVAQVKRAYAMHVSFPSFCSYSLMCSCRAL